MQTNTLEEVKNNDILINNMYNQISDIITNNKNKMINNKINNYIYY